MGPQRRLFLGSFHLPNVSVVNNLSTGGPYSIKDIEYRFGFQEASGRIFISVSELRDFNPALHDHVSFREVMGEGFEKLRLQTPEVSDVDQTVEFKTDKPEHPCSLTPPGACGSGEPGRKTITSRLIAAVKKATTSIWSPR
jgi:hypothetical protein